MGPCFMALTVGLGLASTPNLPQTASEYVGIARVSAECQPLVLEMEHQSGMLEGPPLNDKADTRTQNRILFGLRFEWK